VTEQYSSLSKGRNVPAEVVHTKSSVR